MTRNSTRASRRRAGNPPAAVPANPEIVPVRRSRQNPVAAPHPIIMAANDNPTTIEQVLAAQDTAVAADQGIGDGWNGVAFTVDFSGKTDHVDEEWKLVTTATANEVDMGATIGNILGCRKNWVDPATDVNRADIENVKDHIAVLIAQNQLYRILGACGLTLTLRSSDTIGRAVYNAKPGGPKYKNVGVRYFKLFSVDQELKQMVSDKSHYVALAAIATAIHREQHDGHNWYSGKTADKTTQTYKACKVAGPKTDKMVEFMREFGHDLFHHLNDGTLRTVAASLTGHTPTNFPVGFNYNGVNVENHALHTELKLGQAACDRWPTGTLGIAAIMVGLSYLDSMLSSLARKVRLTNSGVVIARVRAIKEVIGTVALDREVIIAIRAAIGPSLAAAYGYVTANPTFSTTNEVSPALHAYAVANMAAKELGDALYKDISKVEVSREALAEQVKAVFTAALEGLRLTAAMNPRAGSAITIGTAEHAADVDLGEAVIPKSQIERNNDLMASMMSGNKRPASPSVTTI